MFVFDLRRLDRARPRGASAYLLELAAAMVAAAPGEFAAWAEGPQPAGVRVLAAGLEAFLGGPLRGVRDRLRAGLEARSGAILAVPSELGAGALRRYARVPSGAIAVCPPAPPSFQRTSREEAEAARRALQLPERYLLSFGSVLARRRPDLLLEAWAGARPQVPAGTGLVLAGEGRIPGGRREGVSATGYVPPALVPGLLSGALAWLNSSPFEYSTQGLLEAMACGAPPVVAKGTLLADTVRQAGVALDPGDVGMWTAAMVVLSNSAGERGRLSASARSAAAEISGSWAPSEVGRALGEALGARSSRL